mgnify:CR=1 FL=1
MHMPDAIPENMFAPCGMNCMVCYKHCTVCKSVRPCAGCLNGDEGKPRHCRACAIRDCCREKGLLVLTAKTRLRLLPPLTLTAHDVEMALEILGSVLAEMDPSKTEEQA